MNKVEEKPEKIRRDHGEPSRTSSGDHDDKKDRKKHKRRERKEGSSKTRSSERKDDKPRKSSRKDSSSKKDKKKKKQKKRSSSSSDKPEEEKVVMTLAKNESTRRPSAGSVGDLSSASSTNSIEGCAPAVVEVFSRGGVMERTPSSRVAPKQAVSSSSLSEQSSSEESEKEKERDRKPKVRSSKHSSSRAPRTANMDRHKKEVVGALTPEQVAVPRKPAGASRSTPSSTASSRPPNSSRSTSNKASAGGSRLMSETATTSTLSSTTNSSTSSAGRQSRGFTSANASSDASSFAGRAASSLGISTASVPAHRPAPTALKPLKSRDDNRYKREMMRELTPDQFTTVTRKPAALGRRSSGDGSQTSAPPSSTNGTTRPISGPSTRTLSSRPDARLAINNRAPPSAMETNSNNSKLSSHLKHSGVHQQAPSSPESKTVETVLTETSLDDDQKQSRPFKLPGFHRKGKKKSR